MMGLHANKKHIGITSASESISLVFYIYPSSLQMLERFIEWEMLNQSIKRPNNDVLPIYKYLSEIINVWKYLFDKIW